MTHIKDNWAVIVPMANEGKDFTPFTARLADIMDKLEMGCVYLVIDKASKDNTLTLARELSTRDPRFNVVWAPECRNIVDAYLRGYKEAYLNGHSIIIEMDAGLSHDPFALPTFLRAIAEGNDCAFGSRVINGGSVSDAPLMRKILSNGGTLISNLLLGTHCTDMTSGYLAFRAEVVGQFLQSKFLSVAHFYQTELRYFVRDQKFIEIPIHYQSPSPRVSKRAIYNSFEVLFHYFFKRLGFHGSETLSSRNIPLAKPAIDFAPKKKAG